MEKDFEIAKQEIVEIAEQFCGGFVNDYRHALEKIRLAFLNKNLNTKGIGQRSLTVINSKTTHPGHKLRPSIAENSIEELQAELKRCRQIILSQHEKLSVIPQLEMELRDSEKKLKMEVSKVNNKFQSDVTQCNKELKQLHKLQALNSQLEEKVKLMNMEIESFRRQYHKEIDSDGRVSQLQELAASRGKEIQKLEIACNKLKVKISLKDQEIEKITNKMTLLDKEIEELKKTKQISYEKSETSESNNSLVKYLRKKLEEKELEIKKLNKRVCKMQRVEIQCKLKEEGFDNERKEYMDRIAEVCKNNSSLEKIISNSLSKTTSNLEIKKKDPILQTNYENVMEIAKSATEAYNSLLSKEKLYTRSTRPTTAGNDSKWSRVHSAHRLHIYT